jgi:hypothetical protein
MQIPLPLTPLFSIVFASTCLWFAIDAFTSLADITDPVQASGAREIAWFWSFLAVVGVVLALVSWRIAQTQMEDKDA